MTAVRRPTPRTLARYGLDARSWDALLRRQRGVCAICKTLPPSGRLVTDHEHVRNWARLTPERRAATVRGLLCAWCNLVWVRRGATPERLYAAAAYLESYYDRIGGVP